MSLVKNGMHFLQNMVKTEKKPNQPFPRKRRKRLKEKNHFGSRSNIIAVDYQLHNNPGKFVRVYYFRYFLQFSINRETSSKYFKGFTPKILLWLALGIATNFLFFDGHKLSNFSP